MVSQKIWVVLSVFAAIAFAVIAYFYVTTSDMQPLPASPIAIATPPPQQTSVTAQSPEAAPQQVTQDAKSGAAPLQTRPPSPAARVDTPPLPEQIATRQIVVPVPVIIAPTSEPTTLVTIVPPRVPVSAPKYEAPLPLPEPVAAATPPAKKQSTQVIIPLPGRKADH